MERIALKFFVLTVLLWLLSAAFDWRTGQAYSQTTYGYTCVSFIPAE